MRTSSLVIDRLVFTSHRQYSIHMTFLSNVNMQENYDNMQIIYDIFVDMQGINIIMLTYLSCMLEYLSRRFDMNKSYVNIVKLRVGIIILHLAGQMVVASQMTVTI